MDCECSGVRLAQPALPLCVTVCPVPQHSSQRSEERRCLHVHACFCAFLSSEALSAEFAYFVSLDETARQQARQSESPAPAALGLSQPGMAGEVCTLYVPTLFGWHELGPLSVWVWV